MAEIPEDLKEKYVYLVHRMAKLDSESDRESYRAKVEDNQQLSNLQAEKIYIERIATAEARVKELECKHQELLNSYAMECAENAAIRTEIERMKAGRAEGEAVFNRDQASSVLLPASREGSDHQ